MNNIRLTDRADIVGIDATDYDDDSVDHVSTVDADLLLQASEILETLGWDKVDVLAVDSKFDDDAHPVIVIRPPTDSLYAGDQAGIAVAPRTEQGREKAVQEVDE